MPDRSRFRPWLTGVLLLPALSGLMLLAAWPTVGFFPLFFCCFVPLFFAFDEIQKLRGTRRYLAVFLAYFITHSIWMAYSLHWIKATSPQSYLYAVVFHAISIAITFIPVPWFREKFGKNTSFLFLVCAWLSVELLNQYWLLGTPYFTLGNGFGMSPWMIQHYEYIGIEGGTVWLLVCNYLVYQCLDRLRTKRPYIKKGIATATLIFVPVGISLLMYASPEEGKKIRVAALHTYFEPYTDDNFNHPEEVVDRLFSQTEPVLSRKPELVLWPETIVSNLGWLTNSGQERAFIAIYKKLEKYPETTICTGGYGFSIAKDDPAHDPYARKKENFYYHTHNVALSAASGLRAPIRSKEYFIPFQERIPLLKQMPFLIHIADVVGANTMVSHYPKDQQVHRTKTGVSYTPLLCYESIYPLNMVRKSRNIDLIVILANEFWNKDLSGSAQYLYNNVGMAIQGRIPIARSSNSGTSAIIDRKGNILQQRFGSNTGVLVADIDYYSAEPTLYANISGFCYWPGTVLFIPAFLWFVLSAVYHFIMRIMRPKATLSAK